MIAAYFRYIKRDEILQPSLVEMKKDHLKKVMHIWQTFYHSEVDRLLEEHPRLVKKIILASAYSTDYPISNQISAEAEEWIRNLLRIEYENIK